MVELSRRGIAMECWFSDTEGGFPSIRSAMVAAAC